MGGALLQRRIEMCDFRIIRHDDYHGDAILFSVVDEDGREHNRCVSEAEAIEWVVYLEAWAENEERNLPQGWEVVLPGGDDTRADEN
jgi:hypothetical protein